MLCNARLPHITRASVDVHLAQQHVTITAESEAIHVNPSQAHLKLVWMQGIMSCNTYLYKENWKYLG